MKVTNTGNTAVRSVADAGSLPGFARFAWGVLAYNVAVVLWGAYVRASGSGAGCGQHWPLCDGVVLPRMQQTEQAIEFAHRVSSGLVLILAVALVVWAWRAYARGHVVRSGAVLVVTFTITEALLGAGLVLFGWVAKNASLARAVSMALHLVNTFLLLAALTLTAYWASGGRPLRLRGRDWAAWLLGIGALGVLALGTSGAITALGDTLFPAGSLAQGFSQDFAPTAHFLIRLRVIHPVIAISVSLYLILSANVLLAARARPASQRWTRALTAVLVVQLLAGAFNLALLAPIWMQIVHLLLADLTWITFILTAASFLARPAAEPYPAESAPRPVYAGPQRGT